MNELPPTIAAELKALAEQLDSEAAREALLTDTGRLAFERMLRQQASRTMVPERFEDTTLADGPAEGSPEAHLRSGHDRYEDEGPLGTGGMGEIRRVRDPALNRSVALKIIRPERLAQPGMLARFVEEAQITAQLSHPAIVPVHELGQLPDGRAYFTMKQIRGQTLAAVIRDVHAIIPTGTDWNVRRLLGAFLRVCEAIAYAHDSGVIHRDLKPSNIMLGPFGEVLVLDWGLAKIIGQPDSSVGEAPATTVRSDHSRAGRINGTPTYMPPEQARGRLDLIGPHSDVYALGAVLFEILTGQPPFSGATQKEILRAVRSGHRSPFSVGLHTPEGLRSVCDKAMAYAPADRYPNAQALHAALRGWLDGATRRDEALKTVERADALRPRAEQLRDESEELRAQAAAALAAVSLHAPEQEKEPGWLLEDQAAALEQTAALTELQYIETLQTALKQDPELAEAHSRLADFYQRRHAEAEARRDRRAAAMHEALLASHDRGRHRTYLTGDGTLTLDTDPPGAEVLLFRYTEHRRRLRPVFDRCLGKTPLRDVPLPMGSYLLVLRARDRCAVRYPIVIARQEHWHGRQPVHLPLAGALRHDEAYVPAAPTWIGGDAQAYQSMPRQRVWIDGFVCQRHPVTNRRYLAFLNDLVARGRGGEADQHVPREQGATENEQGARIYGRGGDGRYFLQPDNEGTLWRPDWPVVMVDHANARAYAAWLRDRTGAPWRLPRAMEREKATRGTDARAFPWGDFADPAWSCTQLSHPGDPLLADVTAFPVDESPYGVRHTAGLVRDWTADLFVSEPPPLPSGVLRPAEHRDDLHLVEVRGGSWNNRLTWARGALRFGYTPTRRFSDLGIRLVRSL